MPGARIRWLGLPDDRWRRSGRRFQSYFLSQSMRRSLLWPASMSTYSGATTPSTATSSRDCSCVRSGRSDDVGSSTVRNANGESILHHRSSKKSSRGGRNASCHNFPSTEGLLADDLLPSGWRLRFHHRATTIDGTRASSSHQAGRSASEGADRQSTNQAVSSVCAQTLEIPQHCQCIRG